MRRRARLDSNHADIVEALRAAGMSVQSLAALGSGAPDILVGFRGRNHLFEIKDGEKSPSRRALTADEEEWQKNWQGTVRTVTSTIEILIELGILE
jgi:hypothetical protein